MTDPPSDPGARRAHDPPPERAPDRSASAPPAAGDGDGAPSDAALLVHARALEGLRATQAHLAEELAQGRRLREGVERLDAGLTGLADGQARLARELRRTRRRLAVSQWALAGAALLLAGVAAAGWLLLGGDDARPRAAEPAVDAELAAAAEQAEARARAAEREAARLAGEVAALEYAADERVATSNAQLVEQARELERLREERNAFVGEAARLRADLVRAEQRFAALTERGLTLPDDDAPAAPRTSRTSERAPPAAAAALNAALAELGVDELRVLELADAGAGRARDLLVDRVDAADATRRVEAWSEASLVEHEGGVALRLLGRDDDSEARLHVPLPAAPAALFADTPLALPAAVRRRQQARAALEALLAGQALEVLELRAVVGDELRGLRLRALGSASEAPGVYAAERAEVLRDGPVLVLRDGAVTRDGVERPFWRGVLRRPLPGADHAAWRRALDALPPADPAADDAP